jgi:hypothetical protein
MASKLSCIFPCTALTWVDGLMFLSRVQCSNTVGSAKPSHIAQIAFSNEYEHLQVLESMEMGLICQWKCSEL